MGVQLFANNADTTLSGSLPNSGTTLVLYAGSGAKFPNPTGGDYFLLTLFEKDLSNNETRIEIVKVTARTTDTLTIVRDFESTTGIGGGYSYPSSPGETVFCSLRWTAAGAGNMLQSTSIGSTVQAHDADIDWLASNITTAGKAILDDADAAAQRTTLGLVIGTDVQAPLVSGTSIKTINSTSLLGSGDIAITGNATHTGDATGATALTVVAINGTNLAGLATGLLKNTMSTGVPSIATAGTDYVTPTGTETLTNKTLVGYKEGECNLTGTVIDPANGSIQYKTLSGNTTFTESLADGQSVTLMLNPVTYTVTWPTGTWIGTTASAAPTLVASVYNCIVLFQLAGTLYLKYVGRV